MRRRAAPVEGAEPEVHFWAEGGGSGEGGQDDMGGMGEFFRDDDDDGDGKPCQFHLKGSTFRLCSTLLRHLFRIRVRTVWNSSYLPR